MSTSRLSTVSIGNGLTKSNNFWDQNTGFFESIATITVTDPTQSTLVFSSIPATYTHLHIRANLRCNRASTIGEVQLRYNNNTTVVDYRNHAIAGDGATATAFADQSTAGGGLTIIPGASATANIFGGVIWDVLDYANTNKYKVDRALSGNDRNGSGNIRFTSGLWMKTNAITDITLFEANGSSFVTNSTVALYGIRSI